MQEQEYKTIRDRLNSMFSRYQYVGIKNITSEPFSWTVALEQNEILNMGPADVLSEDKMAQKGSGTFLPGDGVTKQQQKIVRYDMRPGEKKMVPGEAAYVLIDKIFRKAIREKYGSDKSGLSKLSVPSFQSEMLSKIIVGPIIKNVSEMLNEVVQNMQEGIEGFSGVEAYKPPQLDENTIMGENEALSSDKGPEIKFPRAKPVKKNVVTT